MNGFELGNITLFWILNLILLSAHFWLLFVIYVNNLKPYGFNKNKSGKYLFSVGLEDTLIKIKIPRPWWNVRNRMPIIELV